MSSGAPMELLEAEPSCRPPSAADAHQRPDALRQAADGVRRPRQPGARRARSPSKLGIALGAGRAEDVLQRRGLLPLPGVDPRRRRLHRAVHARAGEPQPDGAAADDRRGQGRLRAPHHRRHALVRLLAPGQEVGAARADLGPAGGAHARDRGRRPGADHAPARRPGAGLLPGPGGPPDRPADADPVLPRQGRARTSTSPCRPTPAARSWRRSSPASWACGPPS